MDNIEKYLGTLKGYNVKQTSSFEPEAILGSDDELRALREQCKIDFDHSKENIML